jgi:hypothetical protein
VHDGQCVVVDFAEGKYVFTAREQEPKEREALAQVAS